MELDPSSPLRRDVLPQTAMPPLGLERFSERVNPGPLEAVKIEELRGVEMEGRLEDIIEGEEDDKGAGASVLLTSSRMVNMSATEMSLGEGLSSIRYDSSMQASTRNLNLTFFSLFLFFLLGKKRANEYFDLDSVC